MKLVIKRANFSQPVTTKSQSINNLVGKSVVFPYGDKLRIAGVVREVQGSKAKVELVIPVSADRLITSGSFMEKDISDLQETSLVTEKAQIKEWRQDSEISVGTKFATIESEDKRIIDYKDVTISGYGSTFEHITPRDRSGDYVIAGAFDEAIKSFMKNPVMLVDHWMAVDHLAGSWTNATVDSIGLKLDGLISNAPDMKSVRFKVVEKHLKTLSMGGLFQYTEDGFGIEKVYLFEVSLVTVPCNPDCLFSCRTATAETVAKAFKQFGRL